MDDINAFKTPNAVNNFVDRVGKRKIIIITVVSAVIIFLIISAVVGYFYWKKIKSQYGAGVLENAGDTAGKITESATQGVLPSIDTNVLKNKPNVNPADAANPIKNVKINPF
ncbi:MAG: hypothetical protein AAB352_02985 [Patescibacteria group bacterium]